MNEIDELMALDPLQLSEQDINGIIAYQRKQRQNFEAGVKPKKETGPKVSLEGIIGKLTSVKPTTPAPVGKRRM